MTRMHRLAPFALLAFLGACDNEELIPPAADPGLADPLFARYVAFGNSITAGLQSGGINDSTQRASYAVLLAAQMGTEFNIPLLNRPGCPPPFTNVFTQAVVGDPGPLGCALRNPTVPEVLHNVAYPGAEVLEAFSYFDDRIVPSETDAFRSFLLGGQTPVQAGRRVLPTFVTVWLGSNDVLGAILDGTNPGNPAMVTPPADFAVSYAAFMDSLDAYGSIQGGAVIGVPQAALAPYLTQGRVWKGFELQFDAQTNPLNALDVTNACLAGQAITGTSDTAWTSVPFAVGGPRLALAAARVDSVQRGLLAPGSLQTVVIDCADDNTTVTATEVLNMFAAVSAYNAAIADEVEERGWIFIDPNPLLLALGADTAAVRRFPAFPGTAAPAITVGQPFGSAFSLDGIHPSSSTHVVIAGALIQAINLFYGTEIPEID
jgi:lysophospholipase L1-like esterase